MKRIGNLWEQVISFENLLQAAKQAQKGKRHRPDVTEFNHEIEANLLELQAQLAEKTYRPGGYRTFRIYDPKPRLISAAPYRDRVVHHALCNVIQPPIERTFVEDSYANRTGYGTHRALARFVQFARSSQYVLQCDIRAYFPSIDREILKFLLRRKLKCRDTLWLVDRILDSSQGDRGLPIGNLTSQFFANVYLSGFDRFVKEQLRIGKYLRYVDDFALFDDDRARLAEARPAIESYLATLKLQIHPVKSQLFETRHGANFVGFRVLSDRVRVRGDNLRRSRHRLRQLQQDYAAGKVSLSQLVQCLQSWEAHLEHGDTYRLRQQIFESWRFTL